MKIISRHYKKMKIAYIKVAVLAIIAAAFCLPHMQRLESTGDNIFTVYLNGTQVGIMGDIEEADDCLIAARKRLAGSSDEMVLAESEMTFEGDEVLWGTVDDDGVIISNMVTAMRGSVKETLNRSYTVKINEYTVNLASTQEVLALLQASIKKYDGENTYNVDLVLDSERELHVLTTQIYSTEEQKEKEEEEAEEVMTSVGINAAIDEMFQDIEPTAEKDFSDYELGLLSLEFGDTVEVVEAYLQDYELTPLSQAIDEVTKD